MRTELQFALDLARTLDAAEVARFLADIEEIRVTALGVLMRPAPAPPQDELLTVAECAARMKVSREYVYQNSAEWKFARRIGRSLRFSSKGLDAFLKTQSR
jgi:hypothetical protein